MKKLFGLVIGIIVAAAGIAAAQDTTGIISGRLVDTQGLPIPGATVSVTGTQGTRTVVTDGDGQFTVPFCARAHMIRAELAGFETVSRSGIQVHLGQTAQLPLTMRIGGVNENWSSRVSRRLSTRRAQLSARPSTATRSRACRSAAASATRCIWRPASAPAAASAWPIRPSKDRAVSRTSTSSMA